MKSLLLTIATIFLLTGCVDGKDNTKFTPNDGRVLASATCFQCHGTDGISKTSWDSIAGEDIDEFYESHKSIMKAQTKGFSKKELKAIFSYLKTLKHHDD